jgi:hypothetical protein
MATTSVPVVDRSHSQRLGRAGRHRLIDPVTDASRATVARYGQGCILCDRRWKHQIGPVTGHAQVVGQLPYGMPGIVLHPLDHVVGVEAVTVEHKHGDDRTAHEQAERHGDHELNQREASLGTIHHQQIRFRSRQSAGLMKLCTTTMRRNASPAP